MSFAIEHKGRLVAYLHRVWRGAWLDYAIKIAGERVEIESLDWPLREYIDDNGSGRMDPPYWIRTMTPGAFSTFLEQCASRPMKIDGDELRSEDYPDMPVDAPPILDGFEVVEVPPVLHAVDAFMISLASKEHGKGVLGVKPDFSEMRLVIWYGP